FFAVAPPEGEGDVVEHTRDDVVRALTEVHSGADWDALIRERIESPRETLAFDALAGRLGYRIEYADRAPRGGRGGSIDLRSSLGVTVGDNGEVRTILLDTPAWRAGLGYDMTVVGVRTPDSGEEFA